MIRKVLSKLSLLIRLFGRFGVFNGIKLLFNFESTSRVVRKYRFNHLTTDIFLRSNLTDYRLLVSIFCHEEYNSKWIFKSIKNPMLIVDAGANIGLFSIFMHNHYPNAHIISIEPEEGNFKMLSRNTEGISEVTPIKSALWPSNTFIKLNDGEDGDWAFMAEEASTTAVEAIPTITIPEILNQRNSKRIDILKIDIEGSERELFESDYESWLPMVDCLIIELHDSYRPGCGNNFFKAISKYDFFFTKKGENLIFINNNLIIRKS